MNRSANAPNLPNCPGPPFPHQEKERKNGKKRARIASKPVSESAISDAEASESSKGVSSGLESADEDGDKDHPPKLIHETMRQGKPKKSASRKEKYAPPDETKQMRDARTIFVGNLVPEVAVKHPLQKQLHRHILALVPTAKIESTRFRSVAFQTPTSKLPEEGDEAKKSKQPRQHDRDQILTLSQKKKIAFINKDIHSDADSVHAYIVFAHPPLLPRPPNLPPPPSVKDPFEAACLAVEKCNGTMFLDRMLRVDAVVKASTTEILPDNTILSSIVGNPKLSIFVGNLDFASKEEDLRVFFEGIVAAERGLPDAEGSENEDKPKHWVTRVRVVRDKDTQLGKGFAYVQFSDRTCVDEILALEPGKLKFAKRKLRVQRCKSIPSSSSVKKEPSSKLVKASKPAPIPSVPKGDPSLGEKLATLTKEERKRVKAADAERVARRVAKKKARMTLAKEGVPVKGKERERVRKTSAANKLGGATTKKGRTVDGHRRVRLVHAWAKSGSHGGRAVINTTPLLSLAALSHASSQSVLSLNQLSSQTYHPKPVHAASYDDGLFTPVEHLSALSADTFTTLGHPTFQTTVLGSKNQTFATGLQSYVDIEARHIFFYFFESRNDPATDDVIFWTNGGPGCSSGLGLLMELGPCRALSGNGTTYHPESWNTNANIFFVDQPIGVGFSYADYGEYVRRQRRISPAFVAIFFENFDQFKGRAFHMAGESYGGRYIPVFAAEVYDQNAKLVEAGLTPINLQSVMIGNGMTDYFTMTPSYVDMVCTATSVFPIASISSCIRMKQALPRCQKWTLESCVDHEISDPFFATGMNPYDISKPCEGDPDSLCYPVTKNVVNYLDLPSTRTLLGVDPSITTNFSSCSDSVFSAFTVTQDEYHQTYTHISALLERGVRALIYVGTYDWICNWLGNERWTLKMPWTGQEAFLDGQVVGRTRSANGLTFATVDGAGHMVPYDKPKEALALVQRWLAKQEF
ncbi:Alpha/Beta hydrolase protein [Chiua virens]|nr:Alpha/Beta hydrolase protein [Chiua virens]